MTGSTRVSHRRNFRGGVKRDEEDPFCKVKPLDSEDSISFAHSCHEAKGKARV
jgi:hypothetical protein